MAYYDIFREWLAIKYPASRHALWEPSPGGGYERVQIGDVGRANFIGFFQCSST